MTTKALEIVLERDISKAFAREIRQIGAPLITDIVNDATMVFGRCLDSSQNLKGSHEPVLFSYLHMIEMTDALGALVEECCTIPMTPLMRSSFEALLSIKYLLQDDYDRRSLAYLVCTAHRRRRTHNLFDPETQEGQEFKHDWDIDLRAYSDGRDIRELEDAARTARAQNQQILRQEKYAEAENEYQHLKNRSGKVEWYQFYNGPRNLRQLARIFHYGARYDFFYRSWAGISHSTDISRFVIKLPDGKSAIRKLRDPSELATLTSIAVNFMLEAKLMLLSKFHHGEENSIRKWYLNTIRPSFMRLSTPKSSD